jgi:Domain of unknown function (DUF1707)
LNSEASESPETVKRVESLEIVNGVKAKPPDLSRPARRCEFASADIVAADARHSSAYSRDVHEPPDLRVSDQDRERVVAEIREHFAAGRLGEDEMGERVAAAYAARTVRELSVLRADLPPLPAARSEQRAAVAERRADLQRRLLQQAGGALVPFAICTAIWLASGASGAFWPIWVALVAVIPLLRNGWRLYGPAPELDRVERELERRGRRDHTHRRRDRRL